MFEQHPVPQNISSYQFHLVGDMTLKQFLELAGGVLIGVLIYATGLPGLIKWPLILFFAGFGAALAFVPFEERPLERWIIAFFRSVYSPTLFYWKKEENVKYFADEQLEAGASSQKTENKTNISAFSKIPFLSKLEDSENSYLSKIGQLFNPQPTQQNSQVNSVEPTPANVTTIKIPVANVQGSVLTMHGSTPLTTSSSTPLTTSPNMPEKRDVVIPQTNVISVDKQRPHMVLEEVQNQAPADLTTQKVPKVFVEEAMPKAVTAQFSADAAPPSVPTIPNTVSGQVMDRDGKIVEGAILEIRDSDGRPVRALRTNKAGHFLVVTALTNGKYNIVTEKEDLTFEPIEFEANGAIIAPIAIRAK